MWVTLTATVNSHKQISNEMNRRSWWLCSLLDCWDCGFESRWMCGVWMPRVLTRVEDTKTSWSLVQESPTKCLRLTVWPHATITVYTYNGPWKSCLLLKKIFTHCYLLFQYSASGLWEVFDFGRENGHPCFVQPSQQPFFFQDKRSLTLESKKDRTDITTVEVKF
jgi:hypothetical protein